MMKRDEIVAALRWLRPESGDFACEGCGWENSCGVRGCQIMREAADMLENDESQAVALQRVLALRQAQLDCAAASSAVLKKQNEQMRDAAAQVTKLAAEAAVERDWISVEDRLPEEHDSIFAKAYGTKRWADGMFRTISDEVLACVAFEDGHKVTMTLRTHDGAWALSSVHRGHVTHWMPLPEPPKTDDRLA
uniref:DUF551 domain-containing protein n=1 Tax=Siphoviridae sp. ct4fm14 TaxID=2825331 RepID=A0A8S5UT10_9CAUD|nr:MAG TPA: Protein of unknown function (DUF551) [Siphoviridae sp. ct4fm14]